ncbi:MAG: hypothetical protein IKO23_05535 [Bacteroidales bacterium]|nr:hypothetical protein [Bacteroidales bacterium]
MEEQKEKRKKGKRSVMSILGGKFLVKEKFSKQFPFMVYITVLLMAIITNTYIAEGKIRELTKTARKLNDLQVEYVQVKSAIMEASKQSVLAKKLAGTGLKEVTEPLKRIEVEQPEKQEKP